MDFCPKCGSPGDGHDSKCFDCDSYINEEGEFIPSGLCSNLQLIAKWSITPPRYVVVTKDGVIFKTYEQAGLGLLRKFIPGDLKIWQWEEGGYVKWQ